MSAPLAGRCQAETLAIRTSQVIAGRRRSGRARRRQSIAALWVEDGAHFTPSLKARGYKALEAVGFDFLVPGDDGRIRLDYQFLDRPQAP